MKCWIIMTEAKNRRSEGIAELDSDETTLLLTPTQIEVGSGYTVAVSYDKDENQVVDIKTYGEIDMVRLRREIRRVFPKAKIRQLGQTLSTAKTKRKKRKK
jgi:hypothetical protein